MGLDDVEFLMDIEEQFSVVIPEDIPWSKDVTLGEIASYVQGILEKKEELWFPAKAFHAFRQALMDNADIERRHIRPSTPLDEIIPSLWRRFLWKRIQFAMSAQKLKLPELRWAGVGCVLAVIFWVLLGGLLLAFPLSRASCYTFYIFSLSMGVLAAVLYRVMRPFLAIAFPANCTTVRDLIGKVSPILSHENIPAADAVPEDIQQKIIKIASELFNVPEEKITMQTTLYGDLGAG